MKTLWPFSAKFGRKATTCRNCGSSSNSKNTNCNCLTAGSGQDFEDESYYLVSHLLSLLAPMPDIISPSIPNHGGVFKLKTSDALLVRLWELLIDEQKGEAAVDESLQMLIPAIRARSKKRIGEFKKEFEMRAGRLGAIKEAVMVSDTTQLEDEVKKIDDAAQRLEEVLTLLEQKYGAKPERDTSSLHK